MDELTPAILERAALPVDFTVDDKVRRRVAECREYTATAMSDGRAVYGATHGRAEGLGSNSSCGAHA
ncbi:hypothetical protein ACFXG9_23055 [Streptomyces mirabilis]|uniref:hypothetical protein n=1 Tax=Streptomyces mirabilis TaxID=68239 RepID=UPI0036A6D133